MDIKIKILAVFITLLMILIILLYISWAVTIIRTKEKRVIISVEPFLYYPLALVLVFTLSFISSDMQLIFRLLLAEMILIIPSQFITVISPKGILTMFFMNGGYVGVDNLSYEYKTGSFKKEYLYIYNKYKSRPSKFIFGIKNMKTIKMLADYYSKHGYENPLLK